MKIIFMGTPEFAVASLDAINKSKHEVVAVVTVADKPAGRGKKLTPSPVKMYAQEKNIPVLQPINLKEESFIEELKAFNADLFAVVAFRMLPESVWNIPPKGTINLHGSLLPDYRGAAPINWAIINGDKKSGATTFFIEKEIDTGNIIDQVELNIDDKMTAGEFHDKLMLEGANLLVKTINNIETGKINPTPQSQLINKDHRIAPKIFKETCQIDWNQQVSKAYNLIRGLSPYPAAWTNLIDDKGIETGLKIFKTKISDKVIPAGKIETDNKSYLKIGCLNGSLEIEELQLAGKKRMDIKSFLNGLQITQDYTCS